VPWPVAGSSSCCSGTKWLLEDCIQHNFSPRSWPFRQSLLWFCDSPILDRLQNLHCIFKAGNITSMNVPRQLLCDLEKLVIWLRRDLAQLLYKFPVLFSKLAGNVVARWIAPLSLIPLQCLLTRHEEVCQAVDLLSIRLGQHLYLRYWLSPLSALRETHAFDLLHRLLLNRTFILAVIAGNGILIRIGIWYLSGFLPSVSESHKYKLAMTPFKGAWLDLACLINFPFLYG
jgi:hypothetical protein